MTYEQVIEWIEENVPINLDDDFESWWDKANEAFTEEGRNSLDDIFPDDTWKDKLHDYFDQQIAELEEKEIEQQAEQETIQETLEPEPTPKPIEEPSFIESTVTTIKKAISSLRSSFRF